jgi:hypothetical protein
MLLGAAGTTGPATRSRVDRDAMVRKGTTRNLNDLARQRDPWWEHTHSPREVSRAL